MKYEIKDRYLHIWIPLTSFPILTAVKEKERLTTMQFKVLEELKQKKQNKEIAAALSISERAVKFHVSSLLKKVGVRRRQALFDFELFGGVNGSAQ